MKTLSSLLLVASALASTTAMVACARAPDPRATVQATAQARAVAASAATVAKASATLPLVIVHKSPSCGCCGAWVEHLREGGFPVEVRDSDDLVPVKDRVGVPADKASCHTAEVGGYFIEGHVPAQDIIRLWAQKPDARGLVVPGMPAGSPGMEMPDGTTQPYTVELVGRDGSATAFARH